MLDSATNKLVADLQSFLLGMQSGPSAGTTGNAGTSSGASSTAASGPLAALPHHSGSAEHMHRGAGVEQAPTAAGSAIAGVSTSSTGSMTAGNTGGGQATSISGLAQQLMSSIAAYAKQAGGLAGISGAPGLSA